MNAHPYLRAYMAAVLLPTWVLLIWLGALLFGHWTWGISARLQSAMVFPMAVVPNLWGLWNVLYLWLELHRRLSIGAFGALLPVVLVPAGVALASALDLEFYSMPKAAVFLPLPMAVYYLAWKYGVAFFNRIVGLG